MFKKGERVIIEYPGYKVEKLVTNVEVHADESVTYTMIDPDAGNRYSYAAVT